MKPKVVIYCCTNSMVNPEDGMEKVISEYPAEIQISRLPCSGRTDVLYLLRAIEEGATRVMIVGCPEGQCQFLEGNRRAGMRVRYANRLLEEAGLGRDRIRMVTIHGKCEVDSEKDCAWTLIYRRLEKMGKLDNIRKDFPPVGHLAQNHPAKQVHEVYKETD